MSLVEITLLKNERGRDHTLNTTFKNIYQIEKMSAVEIYYGFYLNLNEGSL